ncbi:MAG: hypothetical protein GX946_01830 [Oligosphaeraceae bacterium]|nr:hypothetical protein [Oligosphaeraceae bacterium]
MIKTFFSEKALFLAAQTEVDSSTLFRTHFQAKAGTGVLTCAAEDYVEVFLNGQLLDLVQISALPPEKYVLRLPVDLQDGDNELIFRVHTLGIDIFSHITGLPGLIAEISQAGKILSSSNTKWQVAPDVSHVQTQMRRTAQLGFIRVCDLRKTELHWQNAVPVESCPWEFIAPPLPAMEFSPAKPCTLVQTGVLMRKNQTENPALDCMQDLLSPRQAHIITSFEHTFADLNGCPLRVGTEKAPLTFRMNEDADGVYAIFELDAQCAGYPEIIVKCQDEIVLDFAWGEHLADGRVRAKIHGRGFANRFFLPGGCHNLSSRLERIGARFLECHITGPGASTVVLHKIGLAIASPVMPPEEEFDCSDQMLLALDKVARHTLNCCMHEHYEDSPWREQALYAYDGRNQALFGYFVRGNTAFARNSFDLLGRNRCDNGLLRLTSPGKYERTIPIFSCAWISALYEYTLFSGDETLMQEHKKTVREILETLLTNYDQETGLARLPWPENVWHFYEWVPGLDKAEKEGDNLSCLFNLYLAEALACAEKMYEFQDFVSAESLCQATELYFRDSAAGCYRSADGMEIKHEHTQAMMLRTKIPAGEMRKKALQFLMDNRAEQASFSAMPMVLDAMLQGTPESRAALEKRIFSDWGPMLLSGASTFYEVSGGSLAFDGAGSLCHGWSALPAFYARRVVLGVFPLAPGFRSFEVCPYPGNLFQAKGKIPTPHGKISVSWHKEDDIVKCRVAYPKTCKIITRNYPEFPVEWELHSQ